MMIDVFNTCGVDLNQFLGTHNDTIGVVVEDKDLINHIKGIMGPIILRHLKSDVMRQLVLKIQ
jgi:SWI/SNF-related matrix-associated actin-dependent regulator 1 of chromatin subfamily A